MIGLELPFVGLLITLVFIPPHAPARAPQVTINRTLMLSIDIIDVGQGDSFLVTLPDNRGVLIDAGPYTAAEAVIKALNRRKIEKIIMAITTYHDSDHIGAMERVLKYYPPEIFVDNANASRDKKASSTLMYKRLITAVKTSEARVVLAAKGTVLDLGSGITLEILSPTEEGITSTRSGFDTRKANSLVIRLVYKNFAMLFMGDAQKETEEDMISGRRTIREQARVMASNIVELKDRQWIGKTYAAAGVLQKWVDEHSDVVNLDLITDGLEAIMKTLPESELSKISKRLVNGPVPNLRAQILKIGGHGSWQATSPRLLEAAQPQWAVLSCSANNEYGFPAQSILDRLRERKIKVLRTDLNGGISIESDGDRYSVTPQYEAGEAALYAGRKSTAANR